MKLERFVGVSVHGYRNFDIEFNDDITFLTGINGSGKTTVLNAIIALITPSLRSLAELEYVTLSIQFENEGKSHRILGSREKDTISLQASGVAEVLVFQRFIRENATPPYREADYEQEYYRELVAKHASHPVLQMIAGLPTPMFLGLDRRVRFSDEPARARSAIQTRSGRNVFGGSLVQSLADAAGLAENSYRDTLIAAGRLGEQLRRDMLLQLLAIEPEQGFGGAISAPKRADIQELAKMRHDVEALPRILGLPRDEVDKRIVPFLDLLDGYARQIPSDLNVEKFIRERPPSNEQFRALLGWSANSPQLRRIRFLSRMVGSYNEELKDITSHTSKYTDLVNQFLIDSGKKLQFDQNGYISFTIEGVEGNRSISSLSSGEGQIFVILTQLSFNPSAREANVFLIDEPEISLHVQWQELFVDSIISANPRIQYIMATHSPSIILDKLDRCVDTVVGGKAPTAKRPRVRQRGERTQA